MKRFVFAVLTGAVALGLCAWDNQEWLAGTEWYLGSEDWNFEMYRQHMPKGKIQKIEIPEGSTIYRRRIRKDYFGYFFQTDDKDHVFLVDSNRENKNKKLAVSQRESYSSVWFKSDDGLLYDGGKRVGGQLLADYPLVGIWGDTGNPSEFRLVRPDNYSLFMRIDPIPFFAIRDGVYFFKQIGDRVFETDSSFHDGHMRLEIINENLIALIPLFTLPDEKGLVHPTYWWRDTTNKPEQD